MIQKFALPVLALDLPLSHAAAQGAPPPPQKPAAVWSFDQLLGDHPFSRVVTEPVAVTHDPILGFSASAEGMAGNLWEWCRDQDRQYFFRRIRGGSWDAIPACRAARNASPWAVQFQNHEKNLPHLAPRARRVYGVRVCPTTR